MSGINEEELSRLSNEERAAIEDDDDEADILAKVAGVEGKDDDEGSDDDAADQPAGNDDAGADQAPAPAAEFRPEFVATVPENSSERMGELEQLSADLIQKFSDGDIDMAQFVAEKAALDGEKVALQIAQSQAAWAEKQNESTRDQRWKWEQERFFSSEPAALYKDDILRSALAASVKALDADKANVGKPLAWFLEEADRQVRARFKMDPAPAPADTKPRTPNLKGVPKTLANLPAADLPETGGGEFTYLDKLDGMALERALAKMTPEQEARYLRSAA